MDKAPFIFWDGEGPQDTMYSLFGNSEGDEICYPKLKTIDCLNLIIECGTAKPKSIHCWFGGNYDASMILKDLGWRRLRQLFDSASVVWKGYRIGYVPGKWMSVSNGKVTVKIFDVFSFFACSFIKALQKFNIGTPEEMAILTTEKARRSKFLYSEIVEIAKYMRLELKLGVELMNSLRATFQDAGFNVKSWHGPGALARMALNRHHVRDAMAESPTDVKLAAMYAFAGGRFEMVRGGWYDSTIYNADLRSAYPHFARYLPNLARGKWRYTHRYESGKFGVYHIDYHARNRNSGRIYPLFRRLDDGTVTWCADTEGWYWAPEAELVHDDKDATIEEGWVFDEDDETDRPFAWIEEYFRKREFLKSIGSAAEFTFKLIINSVYGQLAQRTGWDKRNRKPPRYHQLEWAGYITSSCRAELYKLARTCGETLVSIDTDGVYASSVLPVHPTTGLGGWEVSTYTSGVFWQSGIYSLRDDTDWTKTKSRGIPKGDFSGEYLRSLVLESIAKPLILSKNVFNGFRACITGRFDELNTWSEQTIEYKFGGDGKRYHNEYRCPDHCPNRDKGMHEFTLMPVRPGMSKPHSLPWVGAQLPGRLDHEMMVAFDRNDLDEDDRWVLSLDNAA